jgi:hypothetical protein
MPIMPKPARDGGSFSLLCAAEEGEQYMNNSNLRRFGVATLVCLLTTVMSASISADPAGKVSALSWMTGAWAGPAGPGVTLEENWIQPTGGSLASLVRMTTADATPMVELIVIEEESDTLVLRIQQWDPGFSPRTAEPQTMTLTELGERSVKFTAASAGGLKTLAYSSPAPDAFHIDIETADGTPIALKLNAR